MGSYGGDIIILDIQNIQKPKQIIQTKEGWVYSLCQIDESSFASSHWYGRIQIYSKSNTNNNLFKLISSIKQCNSYIRSLIFIKEKQILISSCPNENKIDIYKKEREEEEDCFKLKETLQHNSVNALVETNNGMFISGSRDDKNIKIWQSSSSSSLF